LLVLNIFKVSDAPPASDGFFRSPPVIQVRSKPPIPSDPAFARSFAPCLCDGAKLAADEFSHVITPDSKEQDVLGLKTNESL
jgi:hypothetical protein